MEISRSVSALTELGWSEYESKVYSALVNEGMSTASQISRISEVPANRVYQIIEKLSSKGYVRRVEGKGSPAIYIAKDPAEVMGELEERQTELISIAKEALRELQERSKREGLPISYTISGRREMNVQLAEIIKNTGNEIVLALDTLAEISLGNIFRGLRNLFESGKKVRILTPSDGINDSYEKEVYQKLQPISIRVTKDTFANVIIISDRKTVLFATYSLVDELAEEKNFVGVYSKDIALAKMFHGLFENSWNESTDPII